MMCTVFVDAQLEVLSCLRLLSKLRSSRFLLENQVERYKTSNDLGMNSTSTSPSKTRNGSTSRSPSSKNCVGIEPIAIVKFACSGAAKITKCDVLFTRLKQHSRIPM